jgi:hypothetical protein
MQSAYKACLPTGLADPLHHVDPLARALMLPTPEHRYIISVLKILAYQHVPDQHESPV